MYNLNVKNVGVGENVCVSMYICVYIYMYVYMYLCVCPNHAALEIPPTVPLSRLNDVRNFGLQGASCRAATGFMPSASATIQANAGTWLGNFWLCNRALSRKHAMLGIENQGLLNQAPTTR